MNDAELYHRNNSIQKRDALLCMEEFSPKLRWKKSHDRVLDIGSGDGSVTIMLRKFIPKSYQLLGSDISEEMVNHANKCHKNENTSFTVLDIVGDIPPEMKGNFDHVFSFYALHWAINQERAYTNIYNLLDKDGECFLVYLATMPVFNVYQRLAKNSKWSPYMQDLEKFIPQYLDYPDPAKHVRTILQKIGFIDIYVECRNMTFLFENVAVLKRSMRAVSPFKIPKERYDDFMEDYVQELRAMKLVEKNHLSNEETIKFKYSLLIVHARKPM